MRDGDKKMLLEFYDPPARRNRLEKPMPWMWREARPVVAWRYLTNLISHTILTPYFVLSHLIVETKAELWALWTILYSHVLIP